MVLNSYIKLIEFCKLYNLGIYHLSVLLIFCVEIKKKSAHLFYRKSEYLKWAMPLQFVQIKKIKLQFKTIGLKMPKKPVSFIFIDN